MTLAAALPYATAALVALQTGLMLVDELWFHRRRGLGVLEALGHPFDSLLFLAALLITTNAAPEGRALWLYVALAVASGLVITKDEWIHARECEPAEHWLHAVLFVLHAPILIGVGALWTLDPAHPLLRALPPLVGGWTLFQATYWTIHHAKHQQRVLRRAR